MSTETRNFAIVRRLAQSTPTTPGNLRGFEELQPGDTRYILQAAAWNKNIDAYMCERGIVAVRAYIALALQRAGDAAMNRNHPAVINLSRIFLRELNILSPLLVDDGTFPTAQYVSEHPRGSWRGSHEDFDIRSQAIKLNSTVSVSTCRVLHGEANTSQWVEVAVRCMEYYRRNNRSKYNSSLFQLSLFRLCLGYLHETGHLLQTFVGHGEQDTPPQAGSGRHSSGGEAGEFMEKAFMGGLVDFHNDGTTLGTQVCGFDYYVRLFEVHSNAKHPDRFPMDYTRLGRCTESRPLFYWSLPATQVARRRGHDHISV